jgi:hypothetical protein
LIQEVVEVGMLLGTKGSKSVLLLLLSSHSSILFQILSSETKAGRWDRREEYSRLSLGFRPNVDFVQASRENLHEPLPMPITAVWVSTVAN